MHECTSITIDFFHLFQRTLFNKGFAVDGDREVLKDRMKTKKGRGRGGVKPISILSL